MSLRSDHKALVFLGAVGVLGAGVRVVRAAGKESIPAVQPALEHQARVADSAAQAQRGGKGKKKGRSGRGAPANTGRDQARPQSPGSPDRPGYVRGRLDLDIATAAQIDSLPGVSATMARRIAVDRARRGPFTNAAGLQRVSGVGKRFLQQIDTLVTYSGTFSFVNPGDTVLKSRKKSRK
jgi:DNA uptake protein ComE-like DNA-binding protein